MKISAHEKYRLKKFVKELSSYKARHTELITVYIPVGYDMNKVINHLLQEKGTASNIKSTSTRKNVTDALEKMIQHLRLFKQTPPNGLAVFSGNVAEKEGQSDLQVWSIEPPLPLNTRIYRCDKQFVLDGLTNMMEIKDVFGLVVMDQRDAMIAFLKGKTIIPLKKTHSEVPGKIRAGGQSAPRFARLRQGALKDHYKKIAEYMKEEFLGNKNLRGIIIGGPGTTVNDFINKGYLTGDLQKKVIGTKDLSYTGEFGLQELLDKSSDILAEEEIASEKEIMQKFFELLAKEPNKVTYGEKEVKKAAEIGAVDTLLLSEELDDEKIEELDQEAKKTGAEVKIISTETREGAQLKDLGKIAAILRYALE